MKTNFEEYIGGINPPIQVTPLYQKSISCFEFSSDQNVKHCESEFQYKLNEYGFRCGELKEGGLISVGCSICFGVGVAEQNRASFLLSKELGLDDLNLSFPGKSIEYCYRMLNWAVPRLKPKFVFVQAPQAIRREHLMHNSSTFDFIVGSNYSTMVNKELYDHYMNLMNQEQIDLVYYNMVTAIENLLERYGVEWIFLIPKKTSTIISKLLEERDSRYIRLKGSIDLGRDNLHPGIESHKLWAEALSLRIQGKDIPLQYFSSESC